MGDEIIKDIVTKSMEYRIAFQLLNEYAIDEITPDKPMNWKYVIEMSKHYVNQYYPDINVQDLSDPVKEGDDEATIL